MGKEIEQTFTDNCQHVAMIDLTQYQETNFEERRKVTFNYQILHRIISPSFPGIVIP